MSMSVAQKTRVARCVESLPPSGIREFFELVVGMDDIVTLGVGEPDFATPWTICEEAIYWVERGHTSYTSSWGLLELREEIAAYLQRRFNASFSPKDEILPTVGVSQGYDIILRAILNPGDEVIIHQPCYVSYEPMAILSGGKPVILETRAEDGFQIRPEELEKLVTERTRVIVLNYPCNPTGATLRREALEQILAIAERHDLIVLSDEVYAELSYDAEHVSFASLPGAKERCVLMSGFSKAWAMTGWRLGYLAGPKDLIAAALKIHQYSMLCCSIVAQHAGIEAMRNGDDDVAKMVETYKQRRRVIVDGFNELGLKCHNPPGAFYAFPSIRDTGLGSREFCTRLLKEEKVAIVPGTAFGRGGEGYVRAAYAASFDSIEKALAGIGRMLKRL
ncbi:MAG: putative N-acetyl-LL-diaminopimelate aminotransferase [candidate division BRC1 bacterium ADurb.BinA364]|nr:MAG: putative N-acetyl-LL-diaminopimelate aminotransferase [candidate division BRC1 bacterium ADurb.BinA364]